MENLVCSIREPVYPLLRKVLEPCAQSVEGEPEDSRHDGQEGRNGREPACKDAVYALASQVFLAFTGLYQCTAAHLVNETVSHVGNGCLAVEAAFLFHLLQDVLHCLQFVGIELKGLYDGLVALYQLGCCKTQGNGSP